MGGYLTHDPAVEKWIRMRESTARHFRWNNRNVRLVSVLGLAIPAGILYLAVNYERKANWAAMGPSRKVEAASEEDA
ncbi:hypothetical protein BGZ98_006275 [Dissophora globulifera]|uniref:NADH-ubiquinone oxidoreductase B15 subunit n=1 Tax=Dissophora globulifera TaxID=979702 RepID=A0A9P6RVV1_9FUNG|nr:hypothetical protein BGZ98_006275 [Dissophora globulifera]KAG0328807.1 hypothetical protein BGZ99_004471 [Dissophora globulifera]